MGPTAVIPGTPYYTTDLQDATGAEVVTSNTHPAGWSDDRLERVLKESTVSLDGDDLAARDARLEQAIATGLGSSFEEKKLIIKAGACGCSFPWICATVNCQITCVGTLAVLHFDLFHRGTRRIPGHDMRSMFKLQFFRTSAPTTPTWAHDPRFQHEDAFAGGCMEQRAVWHSVWNWMKGNPATYTSSHSSDSVDITARAARTAQLIGTLQDARMEAERERVGAAYALGHAAAEGDACALKALLSAVSQLETESLRRAAVYGLAASGDVAVEGLVAELRAATLAGTAGTGDQVAGSVVPAIAHALGEAARRPDSCDLATNALLLTIKTMNQLLATRQREDHGQSKDGETAAEHSHGVDRVSTKLRFALATSIQALGCVAERVVSAPLSEQLALQPLAERICDALLPYTTLAVEPGDASVGGGVAGDSHWAREAASLGLLRLASGDGRGVGTGQVIQHTSPAYHSDDRFIAAFGRLAERRSQSVEWLRAKLSADDVQSKWSDIAKRAVVHKQESWLLHGPAAEADHGGNQTGGVWWHDRTEALPTSR